MLSNVTVFLSLCIFGLLSSGVSFTNFQYFKFKSKLSSGWKTQTSPRLERSQTSCSSSKEILALDFDGVVCASAGESSVSSMVATKGLWKVPKSKTSERTEKMIQDIITDVRPIVETGFENMLLVRYVYENLNERDEDSFATDMTSFILNNWDAKLRDELIEKYGSTKGELVEYFGRTRDNMIAEDLKNWVGLNKLYPRVRETLASISKRVEEEECSFDDIGEDELSSTFGNIDCKKFDVIPQQELFDKLYIVTTKQIRFVSEILESNGIKIINKGGMSNSDPLLLQPGFDSSQAGTTNIFDLDNVYGSKINVLLELTNRLKKQEKSLITDANDEVYTSSDVDVEVLSNIQCSTTIHFVEDRFETLVGVVRYNQDNNNELGHVRLYLADWGYNTPRQREEALKYPAIRLISEEDFQELLTGVALGDPFVEEDEN